MRSIAVIDAPTNLGLRPTGVEQLGGALRSAGLHEQLRARDAGAVAPAAYDPRRDHESGVLNADALRDFAVRQADIVSSALDDGEFPLVLGGDDSVLFGNMLALRRRGRFGLIFLDAHCDFYLPAQSDTGEASDLDLAIVTGRGPAVLTDIEGMRPFVRDEDVAVIGTRDAAEKARYGGPELADTAMFVRRLDELRLGGVDMTVKEATSQVMAEGASGFWIHLDADVIDDDVNPAVDYRLPGGLSFYELTELLQLLCATNEVVGMDVSIYNPTLDPSRSVAAGLVATLVAALGSMP